MAFTLPFIEPLYHVAHVIFSTGAIAMTVDTISGGFAGMLGWTVAMPFDVPKTNVQASWNTKVVGSYIPEMVRIGRERGIVGLYNGLGPTLVRAFPANAALFLGVEMGKKAFDEAIWKDR